MQDDEPAGLSPFNLDDVPILLTIFREAQRHGSAAGRLRLAGSGFGTVYVLNCLDAYGCYLSLLEPDPDGELLYRSTHPPVRPARLTRVFKNEFSEILEVDDSFPALLGWSADELIGRPTLELIHPQDRHLAIENWMSMQSGRGGYGQLVHANAGLAEILDCLELPLGSALRSAFHGLDSAELVVVDQSLSGVMQGIDQELEVALFPLTVQRRRVHISLRALTDTDNEVTGAVACITDVTAASDLRHTLALQAATDSLTGYLNRSAIMQEVERWLGPELRHHGTAVAFCDLDQFKSVNDHFGHAAGDELLQVAARRLRGSLRPGALCGRLGGDEFLAVIRGSPVRPPRRPWPAASPPL
jgi:GGDEF domain-containing protein